MNVKFVAVVVSLLAAAGIIFATTRVESAAPITDAGFDDVRPLAHVRTAAGDIHFRLLPDAAPKTVDNFMRLAKIGFFNGTSFYRLEKNFCLQGGPRPYKKSPFGPIPLEYKLPNRKHFVSMARREDPNSAESSFSIMLKDNSKWLGPRGSNQHGFAVFAQVVGAESFATIDAILRMPTKRMSLTMLVPPVAIFSVDIVE